ncbi:GTP-binding translation elongation factor tu family protein, putative [Plasmodium ovale]|uniref:GTP-binding translation elongation factor, putative n=2 Tax=Plasmodium ovale TaxID=36330 RepID=A0A1A8W5I9_PLAOA|nr:GTP-binding translation elongation factor, putative [Plasmodium ovale curtisi]SBS98134.1 GTP-binding translation elongation factor, putative [Plasmodium ovale curtisi]SCQ16877.1 GTP-binding translation elongation factor tu family protein, putative [Plasmodium ovale]
MYYFLKDCNNRVSRSIVKQYICTNVEGVQNRRNCLSINQLIENNVNERKINFKKRRNYYSYSLNGKNCLSGDKNKHIVKGDIKKELFLFRGWYCPFSINKKVNIINPRKIRNVAIIAHVDHGKTTLVDKLLRQGGEETNNERVMDHNDLERERGITIMSKVTRIKYDDYIFNIVDTPGHSDFGGEVERVLSLIDGVCLIIDVVEGPKNQTKFVLKKSLLNPTCKIIVIMNKFDKPSNIKKKEEIENEIFDLFADLNAPDELMNYPVLYASAKNGWCTDNFEDAKQNKCEHNNVLIIFKKIIEYFDSPFISSNGLEVGSGKEGSAVVGRTNSESGKMENVIASEPFSMLVSLIDHQEGVGVTVTGKIYSGIVRKGDTIIVKNEENKVKGNCVIKNIFYMKGRKIENVNFANAGDIVNISISKGITPSVNDTISSEEKVPSLKARPIDPPVLCLKISQNTSPLTGKDGKHITLSSIGNRLKKEAAINVAIEISESERKDSYEVKGRGELQLGILIEKLRREGYEMTISSPNVIYTKDEKGNLLEPIEEFHITIPSLMSSNVIEKLNTRKAEILDIINDNDNTFIKCICPSRNFFGMRSYLRDISKGTSIINSELREYKKKQTSYKSDRNGVIISSSNGTTTAFSLDPIQLKGNLFVNENYPTYEGMIIGEHFLGNDIEMNAVKVKPVQHLRNKGHEETIRINHKNITIEYALSFIQDDEEIEVTPKRIVMRKKILNTEMRKTANRKAKSC